jgi:hypothetical protein
MKLESKSNCPLNNFEPCKLWECSWFIQVQGKNPQTGAEIDEWGCSIAWLPVMLIDNARQQHSTASAIESFRNEMVKSNEISQQLFLNNIKMTDEPKYIGKNV